MFTKTKSREPDFSFNNHITHLLDLLLKEQVNQRKDLSVINALLKSLISDIGIQRQTDDYYQSKLDTHETSPQTESVEQ